MKNTSIKSDRMPIERRAILRFGIEFFEAISEPLEGRE